MRNVHEIMVALRAERMEALSRGVYDPLAMETDLTSDTVLSDAKRGDVLRDPKIRPAGYVHPILRTPSLEEVQTRCQTDGSNTVRNLEV